MGVQKVAVTLENSVPALQKVEQLPYDPAHKKEWSNDSWYNRDGPWKHTMWKNIKGHILHNSPQKVG